MRRAVYLNKDLNKGETIKENHLVYLRPNAGMDTKNFKKIIGKRARKNIKKLEKIIINKNV